MSSRAYLVVHILKGDCMSEMITRRDLLLFGGAGLLSTGLTGVLKPTLVPVIEALAAAGCGPAVPMPIYLPPSSGGAMGKPFANTPEWARNEPGVFAPLETSDGGAGLLWFPDAGAISYGLHDFSGPVTQKLIDEAKSIGLNVIYLTSWFNGHEGDYKPKPGLQEAIAAIHNAGGRVILRIEGLLARHNSQIGGDPADPNSNGNKWSILGPDLKPLPNPYPTAFKMCQASAGWAGYLEGLARTIAGYGADGIYFDDWGDREVYACHSTKHGHVPGDAAAYNNGQIAIAKAVRAVLEAARPDGAIILTEGTADQRKGLTEYVDGALEYGMYSFVTRWLWDAQGQIDTLVPGYSVDHWNQICAIGAKVICPFQYLQPPPGSSAASFLDKSMAAGVPQEHPKLVQFTMTVMWGLHRWRNAGLILGLQMPSFGDLEPAIAMIEPPLPIKQPAAQQKLLEGLRPRAVCIDTALAGRTAPSAANYLKTLLAGRRRVARILDHGSTVTPVSSGSPQAAAWRFNSANGVALSAVNVADAPHLITFPAAAGKWTDAVTGVEFVAKGSTLTVSVPAHRVRLLWHDPCQTIRDEIQNFICDPAQPNAKACEIKARELNQQLQACEKKYGE